MYFYAAFQYESGFVNMVGIADSRGDVLVQFFGEGYILVAFFEITEEEYNTMKAKTETVDVE